MLRFTHKFNRFVSRSKPCDKVTSAATATVSSSTFQAKPPVTATKPFPSSFSNTAAAATSNNTAAASSSATSQATNFQRRPRVEVEQKLLKQQQQQHHHHHHHHHHSQPRRNNENKSESQQQQQQQQYQQQQKRKRASLTSPAEVCKTIGSLKWENRHTITLQQRSELYSDCASLFEHLFLLSSSNSSSWMNDDSLGAVLNAAATFDLSKHPLVTQVVFAEVSSRLDHQENDTNNNNNKMKLGMALQSVNAFFRMQSRTEKQLKFQQMRPQQENGNNGDNDKKEEGRKTKIEQKQLLTAATLTLQRCFQEFSSMTAQQVGVACSLVDMLNNSRSDNNNNHEKQSSISRNFVDRVVDGILLSSPTTSSSSQSTRGSKFSESVASTFPSPSSSVAQQALSRKDLTHWLSILSCLSRQNNNNGRDVEQRRRRIRKASIFLLLRLVKSVESMATHQVAFYTSAVARIYSSSSQQQEEQLNLPSAEDFLNDHLLPLLSNSTEGLRKSISAQACCYLAIAICDIAKSSSSASSSSSSTIISRDTSWLISEFVDFALELCLRRAVVADRTVGMRDFVFLCQASRSVGVNNDHDLLMWGRKLMRAFQNVADDDWCATTEMVMKMICESTLKTRKTKSNNNNNNQVAEEEEYELLGVQLFTSFVCPEVEKLLLNLRHDREDSAQRASVLLRALSHACFCVSRESAQVIKRVPRMAEKLERSAVLLSNISLLSSKKETLVDAASSILLLEKLFPSSIGLCQVPEAKKVLFRELESYCRSQKENDVPVDYSLSLLMRACTASFSHSQNCSGVDEEIFDIACEAANKKLKNQQLPSSLTSCESLCESLQEAFFFLGSDEATESSFKLESTIRKTIQRITSNNNNNEIQQQQPTAPCLLYLVGSSAASLTSPCSQKFFLTLLKTGNNDEVDLALCLRQALSLGRVPLVTTVMHCAFAVANQIRKEHEKEQSQNVVAPSSSSSASCSSPSRVVVPRRDPALKFLAPLRELLGVPRYSDLELSSSNKQPPPRWVAVVARSGYSRPLAVASLLSALLRMQHGQPTRLLWSEIVDDLRRDKLVIEEIKISLSDVVLCLRSADLLSSDFSVIDRVHVLRFLFRYVWEGLKVHQFARKNIFATSWSDLHFLASICEEVPSLFFTLAGRSVRVTTVSGGSSPSSSSHSGAKNIINYLRACFSSSALSSSSSSSSSVSDETVQSMMITTTTTTTAATGGATTSSSSPSTSPSSKKQKTDRLPKNVSSIVTNLRRRRFFELTESEIVSILQAIGPRSHKNMRTKAFVAVCVSTLLHRGEAKLISWTSIAALVQTRREWICQCAASAVTFKLMALEANDDVKMFGAFLPLLVGSISDGLSQFPSICNDSRLWSVWSERVSSFLVLVDENNNKKNENLLCFFGAVEVRNILIAASRVALPEVVATAELALEKMPTNQISQNAELVSTVCQALDPLLPMPTKLRIRVANSCFALARHNRLAGLPASTLAFLIHALSSLPSDQIRVSQLQQQDEQEARDQLLEALLSRLDLLLYSLRGRLLATCCCALGRCTSSASFSSSSSATNNNNNNNNNRNELTRFAKSLLGRCTMLLVDYESGCSDDDLFFVGEALAAVQLKQSSSSSASSSPLSSIDSGFERILLDRIRYSIQSVVMIQKYSDRGNSKEEEEEEKELEKEEEEADDEKEMKKVSFTELAEVEKAFIKLLVNCEALQFEILKILKEEGTPTMLKFGKWIEKKDIESQCPVYEKLWL